MEDWLEAYMAYTEGIPSPEIFRLWSGISALAGAMERRMWIRSARNTLYPNLFILLVAPPAVGKSQAIQNTAELWRATKHLHVAPNNVTRASLIDALERARTAKVTAAHGVFEYHSMAVAASEFGVLLSAHDLEFLSALTDIYDNPVSYQETRRTNDRTINIKNPQLNIIAGVQPGFMASVFPEEAWSQGFASRLLMIYAVSGPKFSLFAEQETRPDLFNYLAKRMEKITGQIGEFDFEQEAKDMLEAWFQSGGNPVPQHSKLQYYVARRVQAVLKLCMVSSISRDLDLLITVADVTRAMEWLFAAEAVMPDIFRDMAGKSDMQVIQELHYFLWPLWAQSKQPIHESRVFHFLQTRVPSEKISRLLDVCVTSQVLRRVSTAVGNGYIPVPKHLHGGE